MEIKIYSGINGFNIHLILIVYQAAARRVAVHGCNKDEKSALARDGEDDFVNAPGFLTAFPLLVPLPMSD